MNYLKVIIKGEGKRKVEIQRQLRERLRPGSRGVNTGGEVRTCSSTI